MRIGTKRYLAELIVSFLLTGIVVSSMIGIRYQSYLGEMERMAAVLKSGETETGEDFFRILKGETEISVSDAEEILGSYGYKKPQDSAAGRQFSRDCACMILGGLILWLGAAGLLGLERYRKKKERDGHIREIVDQLEKIRRGEYLQVLSGQEDPGSKRIADALDSLESYVEMIRSQAHQEKEETKSLVTDLSHQLKTPIASLKMSYEIEDSTELSEEERAEFIRKEREDVSRMENLLQAFVQMTRLETGMIRLRQEKNSLRETLKQAVGGVYMKALKKEILIETEEFPELVTRHDPKWTAEAFGNVLDNAVKYAPAGSRIRIQVSEMVSFVMVEIEDEGPGIPEKERGKIFQRFYRGEQKNVQETEGSGVGLYLTRQILERQKGTVFVKPGRNGGSKFVMTLPKE